MAQGSVKFLIKMFLLGNTTELTILDTKLHFFTVTQACMKKKRQNLKVEQEFKILSCCFSCHLLNSKICLETYL
uniref:Uncharacterized protein n=1 Tax=Arundo donax TaxID=35708 RepID=A0A0A9HQW9_ARUDO